MSHLLVNSELSFEIKSLLCERKKNISNLDIQGLSLSFFYDPRDWENEPIIKDELSELYLSGWFTLNGKRNNIVELKFEIDQKIEKMLKSNEFSEISSIVDNGSFIAVYVYRGMTFIFLDPFSLSSHYYNIDENKSILKLSPYPKFLECGKDELLNDILNAQGHLFGKYTAFNNVYRLLPNDVIKIQNKKATLYSYPFLVSEPVLKPEKLAQKMSDNISLLQPKALSLALSAGFDSRLIASICEPDFTYTWGPETSLDQVVSRKIAKHKGVEHLSFRFKSNKVKKEDIKLCDDIFSGVVTKYNPQFLVNYKFVSDRSVENHIALDGYLGDVLQRGVYLYPNNMRGELLKLFPFLMSRNESCFRILRSRYKMVSNKGFEEIYSDFIEKTKHLTDIDEINKVTFYEFLYGRGIRYITTGALVMNSMFKTVVPCFVDKDIFQMSIYEDSHDVLKYKYFNKIWKNNERFYRKIISEGMYSPETSPLLIPFLNLAGRIVTNKIPRFFNYTKEL
ncbi:TPA: hypothetical protein ACPJ1N_003379 [Vibrio diabolicus]